MALQSLSARRAWIEISVVLSNAIKEAVALRKESVDRNIGSYILPFPVKVALRKESVDRNNFWLVDAIAPDQSLSARRAWIEISMSPQKVARASSLSARRAWIEIAARASSLAIRSWSLSARRAWIEIKVSKSSWLHTASLSARRAWIEIWAWGRHGTNAVSLSARRAWIEIFGTWACSEYLAQSLSARRAWIEMAVCACLANIVQRRSPQGERG